MERELGFFGSNCPGNDTPAAQRQLFYERLAAFYEELKHNSENPQVCLAPGSCHAFMLVYGPPLPCTLSPLGAVHFFGSFNGLQ